MRWVLSVALWALCIPAYAQGGSYSQAEPGFSQPSYEMMEPGTLATAKLPQFENVSFKQHLNAPLPLDAQFKDENGRDVTLADYFGGERPVVLAFVYYSCPMLCTQVMNGVSRAVKVLPFTPGKDFDVVFVSFDPRDQPVTAAAKGGSGWRTHRPPLLKAFAAVDGTALCGLEGHCGFLPTL